MDIDDNTLDGIVEQIYAQCDPDNKDLVPVSKLLDLVKSYMIDNDMELEELHLHLDPANINPSVSYSFFCAAMTQWVAKIRNRNNQPTFIRTNVDAEKEAKLAMSAKQNATMGFELQKAISELEMVKEQLATAVEKNRTLDNSLRKLKKTYHIEKASHDETKKKLLEINEAYESATKLLKKGQRLEKTVEDQKRDFEILENDYSKLEAQKISLENKLSTIAKKDNRKKDALLRCEQELGQKDNRIDDLMRMIEDLQAQLAIERDLVKFYTNENTLLKQNVKYFEEKEEYLSLVSKNSQFEDSYHSILNLFPFDDPTATFDDNDYPLANLIKKIFCTEGKPLSCVKSSPALSRIILNAQNLKRHNSSITFQEFKKTTKLFSVPEESSSRKSLREELVESSDPDEKKSWEGCTSPQECYKNTCDKLQDIIESQNEEIWELKNRLSSMEPVKIVSTVNAETITEKIEWRNSSAQTDDFEKPALEKTESRMSEGDTIFLEMKESMRQIQNDYQNTIDKLVTICGKFEKSAAFNPTFQETNLQKNMGNLQKAIDILISKLPEAKQLSFGKQELRIEKLMDKIDQLENEIACERDIQNTLRTKCKEQDANLENFSSYKIKTDIILQSNKDMLEKHALENRKLAEMFAEDIAVLEHEKKLLLEEVVDLKEKLRKLEELKQEIIAKNGRLQKDLEIIRGELEMEKELSANLREDNQRLLKQEERYQEEIQQLCYNDLQMQQQAYSLRKASNVTIVTLEKSVQDKAKEIEHVQTRVKVREIWTFLNVSSSELARATSNIMVRLRPQFTDDYNYDSLTKLLQDLGQGDNALEVLDVAMIKLNNTIKLAMILLETLADKVQSRSTKDQGPIPCTSKQGQQGDDVRKKKDHFAIQ